MKKYNHFSFILVASFLLWIGCKCNDCPPTFEDTKNGCSCPIGSFKLNEECKQLPKGMYYLPFEDKYCFDTMFIQIESKFCDTVVNLCETTFIVWNNTGGSGASASVGKYIKNNVLGDSIYSIQIDWCPFIKNVPTLGIRGRKHKDDGKWHCTLFIWDSKTGPNFPFEEREVILQK